MRAIGMCARVLWRTLVGDAAEVRVRSHAVHRLLQPRNHVAQRTLLVLGTRLHKGKMNNLPQMSPTPPPHLLSTHCQTRIWVVTAAQGRLQSSTSGCSAHRDSRASDEHTSDR